MYMRLVRNTLQPGQIEEFTRRWEAYFPDRYTQMPGFQHAHLGFDSGVNAILAVTVWEAKPDEAVIATAETVYVHVDHKTLKKQALPEEMRAKFAQGASGIVVDHAGYRRK